MEMHLYWVSTVTYAVVLGIVLIGDYRVTKKPTGLEKSFRLLVSWVIFFCLQDAVWGLCEAGAINNSAFFFVSSSVFHMSTVITTFFWLKYVLDYLGDKVKRKKVYLIIDAIIIFAELLLVILNCFKTTLFEIVDGGYVTGPLRTLTFVNQYMVYFIMGISALVLAVKKGKDSSSNYQTVCMFAIAPIILGWFQLLFPSAPFYSLGYFLGCVIIHVFIVARDREIYLSEEEKFKRIIELNKNLAQKQEEINEQYEILRSIAGVYDYINLVDFDSKISYRFDEKNSIEDSFEVEKEPHTSLNKQLATRVDENHHDKFMEFTNLSSLNEKMLGKKVIVDKFRLIDDEWIRAMYIRIGEDVNAPISKVAYALRNITEDRKREEQVYSALTNLVYSLHIADLENDTFERLIESEIFKKIVGNEESAQKMANTIIRATCKEEFLDIMLKFVNLSTVSERMAGKTALTIEFVGYYHGWTRMNFIPIEMNNNKVKKMVIATEIIDSEKTELINLIYKSSTDELTRLYNRRTYEEDLDAIDNDKEFEELVIVALDVNGLKTVNDNIGHKAGDELIIGASKCIFKSFNAIGKAYRTGGDEFMAILRCSKEELPAIFAKFDEAIESWTGVMVNKLSISYGYVCAEDYPGLSIRELTPEADKKMYECKSEYYRKNGIDRRRT